MGETTIEWTDKTWNPLKGCRRISPGCGGAHGEGGCYAERQGIRYAGPGGAYEGLVKSTPDGPRWTGKVAVDERKLIEPLGWKKPRTVFVDSMSDLFFEAFTDEQVARAVTTMAWTPHVTYQVLTKRAERMSTLLSSVAFQALVRTLYFNRLSVRTPMPWPLPNVWWGVSCEDKKHGLPRLAHLRATPAAIRMVSFEPLLEDLGEVDLNGIHWAIVGGESGPRARPFEFGWARSLRFQCTAAGTAFFFKQAGAHVRSEVVETDEVGREEWFEPLKHKKGGDPSEWPEDLRVREFPEVARGA